MLFYWPKLLYPYDSLLLFFPFLFFLSMTIGWYCEAGVFGLIRCISLSLSLALPTFFNNNNNNIKIEKQTQEDRRSEGQKIAPSLRETRQRSDKLLMTLLAVELRAEE